MNTMNAYSTSSSMILTFLGRALVVAALGCASSACDLGDENLGEDEGGGGSDDNDNSGGDDDGDDDGGALSCEIPDDERAPVPEGMEKATVRITNATAGPIWIPGEDCPGVTRFRVEVDGVGYVDVPQQRLRCSSHYDSVNDGYACWSFSGCEGDDMLDGTVRIGAGESYDIPWGGYAFTKVPIEESCHSPEGICPEMATCYTGQQLSPGTEVSLRVDVNGSCGDFGCDCPEPGEETCVLPATLPGSFGDPLESTLDFALSPSGLVEVVVGE